MFLGGFCPPVWFLIAALFFPFEKVHVFLLMGPVFFTDFHHRCYDEPLAHLTASLSHEICRSVRETQNFFDIPRFLSPSILRPSSRCQLARSGQELDFVSFVALVFPIAPWVQLDSFFSFLSSQIDGLLFVQTLRLPPGDLRGSESPLPLFSSRFLPLIASRSFFFCCSLSQLLCSLLFRLDSVVTTLPWRQWFC